MYLLILLQSRLDCIVTWMLFLLTPHYEIINNQYYKGQKQIVPMRPPKNPGPWTRVIVVVNYWMNQTTENSMTGLKTLPSMVYFSTSSSDLWPLMCFLHWYPVTGHTYSLHTYCCPSPGARLWHLGHGSRNLQLQTQNNYFEVNYCCNWH